MPEKNEDQINKTTEEIVAALPGITDRVIAELKRIKLSTPPRQTLDSKKKLEIGLVGQFVGDKDHAPGYAAYTTIILAFLVIFTTLIATLLQPQIASKDLSIWTTGAFSLISGALGYLFGVSRSTRTK